MTDLKTFEVYKLENGEWKFWMNARGKTAKQLKQSIWWRNKGKVPRDSIKVKED